MKKLLLLTAFAMAILTQATTQLGAAPTKLAAAGSCSGCYFYHGVQVFNGSAGTPDSIVNKDVSGGSKDTNSDSIINSVRSSISAFNAGNTSSLSRINVDTGSATLYQVKCSTACHNPVVTADGPCTVAKGPCSFPYQSGFVFEGGAQTCTDTAWSGDCHYDAIDTSKHEYFEAWTAGFGNGRLKAANGARLDLNAAYSAQKVTNTWGLAGLGELGFADPGEDASLSRINHPLKNFVPTATIINSCGHAIQYSSGTGCGSAAWCSGGVTKCFDIGDILVLNQNDYSRISGCTDSQAKLVIYQLEHFGSPVSDVGSGAGFYFAQDSSGRNDWDTSVFTCLSGIAFNTTNWRILARNYF